MTFNRINKSKGFTLVEILIALILGLVLTASAINIFINNKSTYNLENELSRLQESGRFAIDSMVEDIRMVDYNGCSSRTRLSATNYARAPAPILPFDTDNTIRGFNANATNWTPTIESGLNLSGVINGTDVLNIQRASCGAQLNGNFAANAAIGVNDSCTFVPDDVVLITDCSRADIFEIDSVTNGTGSQTLGHSVTRNTSASLTGAYDERATVYRLRSVAYFIANNNNGEPSLYRSSWTPDGNNILEASPPLPAAQKDFSVSELASGIEDMQILYGEDDVATSDDYADNYKTAANVTNWADVRSVRISLLLRSRDNITQQQNTVLFNGVNVGGTDNRLRLVFTSTASLRNRLP
ncbi:MAG: PilW family protein [Gammaproteobacteria bacterium]